MSDGPKVTSSKNPACVMQIIGKCLRVRRHEQHVFTAVISPAADEYSRPQIFEIRSKARFCEKDERTDILVRAGGYEGRPYPVTDKETGERRSVTPVNHVFDLVE